MEVFQSTLVYIILGLAIAYLAKKFLLPKTLFVTKKSNSKACGQDDCGCH